MKNLHLRKLILPIVATSLLVTAPPSTVAIEKARHTTDAAIPARQWDVIDIAFTVGLPSSHPVDVPFSAVFKGNGAETEVHGFYNGGNEYLLRFTPPTSGIWSYETRSTVASLDGLSGGLAVKPAREGRKGGIRVPPESQRRFQYANGDEYFPIAFESDWLFALDADNPDDIPVTRTFVDHLADNGFNQIVMNVFAYDVTWAKDPKLKPDHDYGSPRSFPFGGDNEKPDHSRLNIDYFKRLDRVIDYLDRKGIAAHLMIYVWNKRVNWAEPGSAEDDRYFDHVVKRYQAFPNLVWDVPKENSHIDVRVGDKQGKADDWPVVQSLHRQD